MKYPTKKEVIDLIDSYPWVNPEKKAIALQKLERSSSPRWFQRVAECLKSIDQVHGFERTFWPPVEVPEGLSFGD